MRKNADIRTGAVGLITSAAHAEEILKNGQGDLIFLAREILRNPYFTAQAAWENDAENFYPHQYLRAKPTK